MSTVLTAESKSKGKVYWITGLSAAGKSTLAVKLRDLISANGHSVVLLDGDAIRQLLLATTGYTRNDRLGIARFNARLCRFLANQGLQVICPTISLFHEVQAWNRAHIPGYIEIYLDVPLCEAVRRDKKGIYASNDTAEAKNVVGIDILPEFPLNPDIHVTFEPEHSADKVFQIVINELQFVN